MILHTPSSKKLKSTCTQKSTYSKICSKCSKCHNWATCMCEIEIAQEGLKRDWLAAPVGSERTLASSKWSEDKSILCDSCPAGKRAQCWQI